MSKWIYNKNFAQYNGRVKTLGQKIRLYTPVFQQNNNNNNENKNKNKKRKIFCFT